MLIVVLPETMKSDREMEVKWRRQRAKVNYIINIGLHSHRMRCPGLVGFVIESMYPLILGVNNEFAPLLCSYCI